MKKKSNIFASPELQFKEKEHQYLHLPTERVLTSVTTVIHNYQETFDSDGSILKRKAFERGISEAELQAEWTKKGDDAKTYGTSVHASLEYFIDHNKVKKDDPNGAIVEYFQKNFSFGGELFSEVRLYNLYYGIAGTADLLELMSDGAVNIYDFKTNAKINEFPFKNKDGTQKKLLGPLSCFSETTKNIYQMQLSTYAYMIQERFKRKIGTLKLFHINKETAEIQEIPLFYCFKRVKMMLEDFYQKENF